MANITIANSTKRPICSNGAMAFIMDLSTTCRPKYEKIKGYELKEIYKTRLGEVFGSIFSLLKLANH